MSLSRLSSVSLHAPGGVSIANKASPLPPPPPLPPDPESRLLSPLTLPLAPTPTPSLPLLSPPTPLTPFLLPLISHLSADILCSISITRTFVRYLIPSRG